MRKLTYFTLIVALCLIATFVGLAALQADQFWSTVWKNTWFRYDVRVGDDLSVTGDLATTGTLSTVGAATFSSTVDITGVMTRGGEVLTASAVSLTSPTVTFDATGKGYVILQSDANLTGVHPTTGTLGQVLLIRSGAGNNTVRFDDGTSMSIGANVTLTEGQNDVLGLVCTSPDGDEWAAWCAHDN